jgi:hypothetical protein
VQERKIGERSPTSVGNIDARERRGAPTRQVDSFSFLRLSAIAFS